MANGTPSNVSIGPGLLWVAPLGTPEPTAAMSIGAPVGSGWRQLGYTEDGNTFGSDITTQDIEVAEETEPILTSTTKRVSHIDFKIAESTATNLLFALNQGVVPTGTATRSITTTSGSVLVTCASAVQSDRGRSLTGSNLSAGTWIVDVVVGTSYTINQVPSSAATATATLGALYAISPVVPQNESRAMLALQTTDSALWLFRKVYNTGALQINRSKAPAKSVFQVSFRAELPTVGASFTAFANSAGLV